MSSTSSRKACRRVAGAAASSSRRTCHVCATTDVCPRCNARHAFSACDSVTTCAAVISSPTPASGSVGNDSIVTPPPTPYAPPAPPIPPPPPSLLPSLASLPFPSLPSSPSSLAAASDSAAAAAATATCASHTACSCASAIASRVSELPLTRTRSSDGHATNAVCSVRWKRRPRGQCDMSRQATAGHSRSALSSPSSSTPTAPRRSQCRSDRA
mmetsp:Transcript_24389/g.84774  ORF Transcript_24389/g.84774 Transcript_24389/m.84774 type:complete len:213 (+) Transcript_24389:1066-1704(+)